MPAKKKLAAKSKNSTPKKQPERAEPTPPKSQGKGSGSGKKKESAKLKESSESLFDQHVERMQRQLDSRQGEPLVEEEEEEDFDRMDLLANVKTSSPVSSIEQAEIANAVDEIERVHDQLQAAKTGSSYDDIFHFGQGPNDVPQDDEEEDELEMFDGQFIRHFSDKDPKQDSEDERRNRETHSLFIDVFDNLCQGSPCFGLATYLIVRRYQLVAAGQGNAAERKFEHQNVKCNKHGNTEAYEEFRVAFLPTENDCFEDITPKMAAMILTAFVTQQFCFVKLDKCTPNEIALAIQLETGKVVSRFLNNFRELKLRKEVIDLMDNVSQQYFTRTQMDTIIPNVSEEVLEAMLEKERVLKDPNSQENLVLEMFQQRNKLV